MARAVPASISGLFQDLMVWYHLRPSGAPEIICLTPNRTLRQGEYDMIVGQPFMPRLMDVLPPPARPVRVGESWPVTRRAALGLLGKLSEDSPLNLEATLFKIVKAPQGTELMATIEVSGEFEQERSPGSLKARITFLFEPPATAPAPAPAPAADSKTRAGTSARTDRDAGILEARGYIAKVQMGLSYSVPIDDTGRLQRLFNRGLVLARRKLTDGANAASAPLPIPAAPPIADPVNSWIVYDDPQGRFHFRRPQELEITKHDPDGIQLQYVRPGAKADSLVLALAPRDPDPIKDRKWTDPQAFVRDLQQNAARHEHKVVTGEMGWLPDKDWAPLNRKVYRYEMALKTTNSSRFYDDAYLVLFTRGNRFHIHAMTDREDHRPFRDQAEQLIKSLELGPSTPGMNEAPAQAASPAQASPGTPPATRPTPSRPGPPPIPRTDRSSP